jgi:hypothetical protein
VSHAAIKTRNLFCKSQKQTFDKFVDLPTPLTPIKVMMYGSRGDVVSVWGRDALRLMSRRMSVELFDVRIWVMVDDRAALTCDLMPAKTSVVASVWPGVRTRKST